MFIFKREIENQIREKLFKNGIVTILGPRQSGKTTLSKKIIESFGEDGIYVNCEFADIRKHFVLGKPDELLKLIDKKKIVVFDEAQTIENIGKILKVFYDTYPQIQIIATGSSSFDLSNKIKEPMTGRAYEFTLLPLSIQEIMQLKEITKKDLELIMKYGSYPAVIVAENENDKKDELKKIATNYLYKDIYIFEAIRNPKIFEDLLMHLAYAVGNTVSAAKIGKDLGVAPATIEKYIRLLEQSFVIKRIYSYSRNYANELKKSYKVYFMDVGVRNALVGNFDLNDKDKGVLFENIFFSEQFKKSTMKTFPNKLFFWRTKQGLEIDCIESGEGKLFAIECKFGNEDFSFKTFKKHYPEAQTYIVRSENFIKYFSR